MSGNQTNRKLAAILFADIVGYTSLMQSDEALTLQIIKRYQSILGSAAQKFNGQVLKNYGDGSLMTFSNSVDAVKAARQIQTQANSDPSLPNQTLDVPLRIGIHVGEFVVEKGDIYGNGVNLASRIESLGIQGAVLFSKNVCQKIKNQPEFEVKSLGFFDFKNVEEPMEVFALANEGFPVPKREEMQGKLKKVEKKSGTLKWITAAVLVTVSAFAIWFFNDQKKIIDPVNEKSIAVLPFVNMSADVDQVYFSDGMSEEIINKLAQVPTLKVTGRTSSFSFRGKDLDLQDIGKKLKVSHILEGSVRKSGNTLRITAQLIKVSDGFHLYSKNFDRELEDVFAIQDEISEAILNAVKISLLPEENNEILRKYTDNVEAYQHYIKGRFHFNKYEWLQAIESYQSAIKIDSNYAIAYAHMSICYTDIAFFQMNPDQNRALAEAAAEKALEIDDQSSESHYAIGRIKFWHDWDFEAALYHLDKAIQINPNNVEALQQMGRLTTKLGRYEDGYEYLEKAENLDPFSLIGLFYVSGAYGDMGNWTKVEEYADRMIDIEPNFFGGHVMAAAVYWITGKSEESVTSMELAGQLNGDVYVLTVLAQCYAANGQPEKSIEILEKIKYLTKGQDAWNSYFGVIYAALGEWELAFEYFDQAIIKKEPLMMDYFLKLMKYWHPEMKNDPRVIELLERIGLPY